MPGVSGLSPDDAIAPANVSHAVFGAMARTDGQVTVVPWHASRSALVTTFPSSYPFSVSHVAAGGRSSSRRSRSFRFRERSEVESASRIGWKYRLRTGQ